MIAATVASCSKDDDYTRISAFEDATFKTYVLQMFDTDRDGKISPAEAAAVETIYVHDSKITSLKGIEVFVNLKELYCFGNELTVLDISKNTALTGLWCSNNKLTRLYLPKSTALKTLGCSDNQLTQLDVSKNTALIVLMCSYNKLTALDVTKNTALIRLECRYNNLTALDVSKNTALEVLYCNYNKLTTLDVSNNTALSDLSCTWNPGLTKLWLKNGQTPSWIYKDDFTLIGYK